MANINIPELNSAGADLFSDSESFISELADNEFSGILGGFYVDTLDDWCGTTKITRTVTFPTKTIVDISFQVEDNLVINQVLPR